MLCEAVSYVDIKFLFPGAVRLEERRIKTNRRNSDSSLYCKALDCEEAKERPVQRQNQAQYLDQTKRAFVEEYLEKAEDARSVTTETSDSGMPGTQGAPSELGIEETSGKLNYYSHWAFSIDCVCLKCSQLRYYALKKKYTFAAHLVASVTH